MQDEKLKFTVELSGTYWGKLPQFSIWLDECVITQSEIHTDPQIVTFERTVYSGAHSLSIRLENKTHEDTFTRNGEIVKDMLLNIKDITINDISLGNLLWTAEYILDEPQDYRGKTITRLDSCVNLGWNGTYKLSFTSPFYNWLLEKL